MSLMTIDEAREILGEEMSANFTDEQLQEVIWNLTAIARETIKSMANGEFQIPHDA